MTKELPGVIAEHIRGVNAIDTDAIVCSFPRFGSPTRYFTHFLGIKGAGYGQILADAESPEPGACE
jgi:hypothetical protein